MTVTATPTADMTSGTARYGRVRRSVKPMDQAVIPQLWAVIDDAKPGPGNVLGWVWTFERRDSVGLQWFNAATFEFNSLETLMEWVQITMSYSRAVLVPYAVTPVGTEPLPLVTGDPGEPAA